MSKETSEYEAVIDHASSSSLSMKKVIIAFSIIFGVLVVIVIFSLANQKPKEKALSSDMYEVGSDGTNFRLREPESPLPPVEDVEMEEAPQELFPRENVSPPNAKEPPAPLVEKKDPLPVVSAVTVVVPASESILSVLQQSPAAGFSGVGQSVGTVQEGRGARSTDRQQDFLDRQSSPSNFILPSIPEPILSDVVLSAGTKIPITLQSGINSATPGEISAIITQDIYATYAPDVLIIPRGSWLLGTYQTSVAYGTERALVAWSRLIRPDGVSIDLRGMQAIDLSGYAGLPAKVDNHWDKILGAVLVATVLNIGSAEARQYLDGPTLPESIAQSFGATVDTTQAITDRLIERSMNIPPHLRVAPGTPAYLFVRQDIYLSPYKGN